MLGLPWPEWGETDVALGLAAEDVDAAMCACGCGFTRGEAHDPAIRDRVLVETETCLVRQAIEDFKKQQSPGPDQLLRTTILAPGDTKADHERDAFEALRARMLAGGS